jgi:hypothetical protein
MMFLQSDCRAVSVEMMSIVCTGGRFKCSFCGKM